MVAVEKVLELRIVQGSGVTFEELLVILVFDA